MSKVFAMIARKVEDLPEGEDKEETRNALKKLEVEARKGNQADEGRVRKWLTFLAGTDPDAWEVAVDTFIHPVKGLSTAFRKLLNERKQTGHRKQTICHKYLLT